MAMDKLASEHAVDLEMKIVSDGYRVKRRSNNTLGEYLDVMKGPTDVARISANAATGKWRLTSERGLHSPDVETIAELIPRTRELLGIT